MSMDVVTALIEGLGKDKVLLAEEVSDRYSHIWTMDQSLKAKAVTIPSSTEDVSKILKICHSHNQSIVVHGGLTNLVGGTETNADNVVVSMERLDKIEEVDEGSRTMTVQAGVILEVVQNAAKEVNLLFPLNFGAKGSAQIGGAISANAGGLRVVRFGMTRNLVLGIEAALADGTVVTSMKKIVKDNSGYDLRQLFVGSEGTLGIVTKAVLKLVALPKSRTSAYVAFNQYEKVVEFLKFMDGGLAGIMSGFELIWGDAYEKMTSPPAEPNPPLPQGYKYYVLVEAMGSDQEKDQQKLQDLLEEGMEQELLLDACLADGSSDLSWFWKIREDVQVLSSSCVVDQHFDISLPIPLIGDQLDKMYEQIMALDEVDQCYRFGHVADGNIHLIIGKLHDAQTLTQKVNDIVYGPLATLGGSISAEHGVGLHKKAYLPLCRTAEEIQLMKVLKSAMDPKGILNPGRIFD